MESCTVRDGLGRVCDQEAVGKCCMCHRSVCSDHRLVRGRVATTELRYKCPDCDYEEYLGSPGA